MSHGNELDIWLNLYSVQYLCRVTANGNRKRLCSIKNKILRDLVSNNYSLTHSKHLFLCLRGISELKKHFPQEKSSLDLILLTVRLTLLARYVESDDRYFRSNSSPTDQWVQLFVFIFLFYNQILLQFSIFAYVLDHNVLRRVTNWTAKPPESDSQKRSTYIKYWKVKKSLDKIIYHDDHD